MHRGLKFCRSLRAQITNSFTTNIKLGLIIRRLLPAALQYTADTHIVDTMEMNHSRYTGNKRSYNY